MAENKMSVPKNRYANDFINKIIRGNCLELIKSMPDKKIDYV